MSEQFTYQYLYGFYNVNKRQELQRKAITNQKSFLKKKRTVKKREKKIKKTKIPKPIKDINNRNSGIRMMTNKQSFVETLMTVSSQP